ncbi:MAG: YraN family protein, partial [Candidatus Binatia bacterium]
MKSYDARRDLGQRGERAAEDFLRNQGYLVIAKNYRSPYGEIDLIAFDRQTIVFVEVRTQSGEKFGDPVASVNWRKQKQIARTALYYLMRHGAMQDREARF